mmetsp:Transcript_67517/g.159178  ORF Transcript_67517/g.159178 Transcript_67517/m.159178 type:complete len:269 (-) Transcript_67517:31-837(-)
MLIHERRQQRELAAAQPPVEQSIVQPQGHSVPVTTATVPVLAGAMPQEDTRPRQRLGPILPQEEREDTPEPDADPVGGDRLQPSHTQVGRELHDMERAALEDLSLLGRAGSMGTRPPVIEQQRRWQQRPEVRFPQGQDESDEDGPRLVVGHMHNAHPAPATGQPQVPASTLPGAPFIDRRPPESEAEEDHGRELHDMERAALQDLGMLTSQLDASGAAQQPLMRPPGAISLATMPHLARAADQTTQLGPQDEQRDNPYSSWALSQPVD